MAGGGVPYVPGERGVLVGGAGEYQAVLLEAAEKVDTTAYIWYNAIIKYRRWYHG